MSRSRWARKKEVGTGVYYQATFTDRLITLRYEGYRYWSLYEDWLPVESFSKWEDSQEFAEERYGTEAPKSNK